MAYLTLAELVVAMSPAVVTAIFDDDSDSVIDEASVEEFIDRGSAMTDSVIAPVYSGPFPITQQPVPAMIKEHTLQWTLFFILERFPEFTRTLGQNQENRYKQAVTLGERLQSAVLRIPDLTSQPKPANVGGIVRDDGKRIFIDSADGTSNRGDF